MHSGFKLALRSKESFHATQIKSLKTTNARLTWLPLIYSDEAEALAKKLKLRFYRSSVKEDLNVKEGINNAFSYVNSMHLDF